VSKQRAAARAEREATAAATRAKAAAEREQAAARRAKRERRALAWRRTRLWQHGPSFRRNKERWAALVTLILVVLLCTVLFTGSLTATLFVALVAVIASPALVMLFFDRSRK
jgi:Flp pilus assembly protein TadB